MTVTYTVLNNELASCSECGCSATRIDPRLKIRLYVQGNLTVSAVESVIKSARRLGASDDALLIKENGSSHYVEIDAEGFQARLEIADIKASAKK
jgi:hypothetical protein